MCAARARSGVTGCTPLCCSAKPKRCAQPFLPLLTPPAIPHSCMNHLHAPWRDRTQLMHALCGPCRRGARCAAPSCIFMHFHALSCSSAGAHARKLAAAAAQHQALNQAGSVSPFHICKCSPQRRRGGTVVMAAPANAGGHIAAPPPPPPMAHTGPGTSPRFTSAASAAASWRWSCRSPTRLDKPSHLSSWGGLDEVSVT